MKSFFSEFFKFLSDCVLIICLSFSAFLLIINIFHYKDVSYKYYTDFDNNPKYSNLKKDLVNIDKKMKSVNYLDSKYSVTAKPIYSYFEGCKNALNNSYFMNMKPEDGITAYSIYKSNADLLNDFNSICMFDISNNISNMEKEGLISKDFNEVAKRLEENRKVVVNYSNALFNYGLKNSSYSFSTNVFKSSIYNDNEYGFYLTLDNYSIMISMLDDIADWYVSEFGGNL